MIAKIDGTTLVFSKPSHWKLIDPGFHLRFSDRSHMQRWAKKLLKETEAFFSEFVIDGVGPFKRGDWRRLARKILA